MARIAPSSPLHAHEPDRRAQPLLGGHPPAADDETPAPLDEEYRRLIWSGVVIGWASIVLIFASTLLSHTHPPSMSHAPIWWLSTAAALVNNLGLILLWRPLAPRTMRMVMVCWPFAIFAFIASISYLGGGFAADFYVGLFPAVVFAAIVLSVGAAVAATMIAALLYIAAVYAGPGTPLWGNLLLRAGAIAATAAIAAVLASLERQQARRRARSEAQAEARAVLLQEIHHRVKNDLQTVAELLSLEADRAPGTEVARVAEASIGRIQSMAAVHRLLAGQPGSTDARAMGERVVSLLRERWGRRGIDISLDGDEASLTVEQATCLALVMNELATNAFRHAFPDGRDGTVRLTIARADGLVTLRVSDDGIGIGAADQGPDERLGLVLVRRLVTQGLRGEVIVSGPGRGTVVDVVFPHSREGT